MACRSRRSSSNSWALIVAACLALLLLTPQPAFSDIRRPKNVQAALRAKWSGTPLLLEAGYGLLYAFLPLYFNISCIPELVSIF